MLNGFLEANLGVALLLLVLLLTCGRMAFVSKSGSGAGGEGAAPPHKAWGGSRCTLCLVVVPLWVSLLLL